ncbi:hypothetical protein [Peribacillus sp. YIM B13477]|uniref:hypothetical protein n=1 Tax=Peribacillus sp. YIM B13477 TaxID=3366300 RepID=UPI00367351B1
MKIEKNILITLIFVIGFITIIPFIIIIGMKWQWTSFAYGSADGWLGFWGGYIGAIIGALAAGFIAYYVAHKQIHLQVDKEDLRARKFLGTQLRIDKFSEIYSVLSEMGRNFAESDMLIFTYHFKEPMELYVLRDKQREYQDKDLSSIRNINSLFPFVPDLKNDIDNMMEIYHERNRFIYKHYIHRKDPSKKVSDSIYEDYSRKSDELMIVLHVILTDISNKLSHEIDKLEKGIN